MSEPIFPIIETDATELYRVGMERIADLVPDFDTEVVSDPTSWLLEAVAEIASEVQATASLVPEAIFRYYGENILNIPLLEGEPATADITVTIGDALGHTIPEGTTFQLYLDGDVSYEFVAQSDVIIPNGSSTATFTVTCTTATEEANGAGVAGAELVDAIPYITFVTVPVLADGGSSDETDDEYLSRLTDTLQLLSTRPITARDFEISARANFGGRWLCLDTYAADRNLLTANQASVETNTTGLVAGANATIAQSAAQAADGTKSLAVTSVAAGDMIASTLTGTSGIPVTPGETFTGRLSSRAATEAKNVDARIYWYTADGAACTTPYIAGTAALNSLSAWTDHNVTAVVPDDAAYAAVAIHVAATSAAGRVHYADKLQIRRGTSAVWMDGGLDPWNQPLTVTLVGIKDDGTNFTALELAAVKAFFDLNKLTNFVVFTMPPSFQSINVAFTITADDNADTALTIDAAEANVATFLSSETWGLPSSGDDVRWELNDRVRFFDLVSVIVGTVGVKSLDALTVNGGSADVMLLNKWTIAKSGTITGVSS